MSGGDDWGDDPDYVLDDDGGGDEPPDDDLPEYDEREADEPPFLRQLREDAWRRDLDDQLTLEDIREQTGLDDTIENNAMLRDQLGWPRDPFYDARLTNEVYIIPETGDRVDGLGEPDHLTPALPFASLHIEIVLPGYFDEEE
jgi:hypothetical protein